jgi:hypothetical protein
VRRDWQQHEYRGPAEIVGCGRLLLRTPPRSVDPRRKSVGEDLIFPVVEIRAFRSVSSNANSCADLLEPHPIVAGSAAFLINNSAQFPVRIAPQCMQARRQDEPLIRLRREWIPP